jgi:hypothetical protein
MMSELFGLTSAATRDRLKRNEDKKVKIVFIVFVFEG